MPPQTCSGGNLRETALFSWGPPASRSSGGRTLSGSSTGFENSGLFCFLAFPSSLVPGFFPLIPEDLVIFCRASIGRRSESNYDRSGPTAVEIAPRRPKDRKSRQDLQNHRSLRHAFEWVLTLVNGLAISYLYLHLPGPLADCRGGVGRLLVRDRQGSLCLACPYLSMH